MTWISQIVSMWLTALVWIGGLTLVFLVLTRFSPCNPGKSWWADRRAALTDLVYWLLLPLFTHVGRVALLVAGVLLVYGNAPPDDWVVRRWSIWVQCLCILLVQDVILYWLHRLFHTPAGWRFHAVHHSPEVLDWTSTQRFHPVNAILEFAAADVVVLLMGFSPDALIVLGPLNLAYSVLVHANLNWTFGPLRFLLVSPVYHRWHHTAEEQGRDRNFASTFPFLDLLFGTYHMPVGKLPEQYGTTDGDVPRGFVGQMVYPLHGVGAWAGRHPVGITAGGLATAAGIAFGLFQLVKALETPPALTPAQIEQAIATQSQPASLPTSLQGDQRTIGAVAVSVRRSQVLLGGSDGALVVRNAAGDERTVSAHAQRVNTVATSPDDALIITGGIDSTARVWSAETGQLLRTLRGHGSGVMSVAIASDGWATTGSADGFVRVWNPEGDLTFQHRTGVPAPVHAVSVCDGAKRVVIAQLSTASLWEPNTDKVFSLAGQTELVYCVGLSANGEVVLTGGYDGRAKVWDATGRCRNELKGHDGPVYSVVLSRDGKRVLTGGADKTVRVWQTANGQLVRELGGHDGLVFAVSADDTGKRIAAAGKDGRVSVWDVPDGDVVPASAIEPGR